MKALFKQSLFIKFIALTFSLWFTISSNGQTILSTKQFEIIIVPYYLPGPPLGKFIIKENELSVSRKTSLNEDTILFITKLNSSDTLKLISEINFNKFERYYSNNCIDDGLRMSAVFRKNKDTKPVLLDNYYHEDIGTIINFINSIVPTKYKIWYDKERLIADYKNCKSNN